MAWNVFRFCSGLRVLGYLMILLVAAIVSVSYYAIIIVECGSLLRHGGPESALAILIITVFHLLLLMLLWSYFMAVFTDPGSVPQNWLPLAEENPESTSSMASAEYANVGNHSSSWSPSDEIAQRSGVRFCNSCQNYKPPRCHHCSICQRCVLKMDHHCIWVVNCVGARNYKFFLLFLEQLRTRVRQRNRSDMDVLIRVWVPTWFPLILYFSEMSTPLNQYAYNNRIHVMVISSWLYTFLETTLDTVVLLPQFIMFFGEVKNHSSSPGDLAVIFLTFVLNLAFALSLLGFVILHSSLLLSNTTTIEVYEKKKGIRWKYDLGKRKNMEQVFGTRRAYWLLPLYSEEDLEKIPALHGLEFQTRSDAED